MTESHVEMAVVDGIATIELARPSRANSLDPAMFTELSEALDCCATTDGVRVIVISGRGKHFCAGGDLDHPVFDADGPDERRRHLEPAYDVTTKMLDASAPIVVAVQGRCAGAGLALVLASDLRIASASATFSLDFVRLGLVPDMGVSWLLGQAVGTARALDLALTAEVIDADTAMEWGIVSRVVADGAQLGAAMDLARSIAEHPPGGLQAARRLVRSGPFAGRSAAFEQEISAMNELIPTTDAQARLQAFRDRRRAKA